MTWGDGATTCFAELAAHIRGWVFCLLCFAFLLASIDP